LVGDLELYGAFHYIMLNTDEAQYHADSDSQMIILRKIVAQPSPGQIKENQILIRVSST
jgi:hypothetical protein